MVGGPYRFRETSSVPSCGLVSVLCCPPYYPGSSRRYPEPFVPFFSSANFGSCSPPYLFPCGVLLNCLRLLRTAWFDMLGFQYFSFPRRPFWVFYFFVVGSHFPQRVSTVSYWLFVLRFLCPSRLENLGLPLFFSTNLVGCSFVLPFFLFFPGPGFTLPGTKIGGLETAGTTSFPRRSGRYSRF